MDVTVTQPESQVRVYKFSGPINPSRSLNWLRSNRGIESFEATDDTLSITAKDGTDWDQLDHDFIMPGLERTFGALNVTYKGKTKVH